MVKGLAVLALACLVLTGMGVSASERAQLSDFKPQLAAGGSLLQGCKPVKSCNADSGCPGGKGCLQTPTGKFCCDSRPVTKRKLPDDCVEAACGPGNKDGCSRPGDDCYIFHRKRYCCASPPY